MNQPILYDTEAEWLAARRQSIRATDIAGILGLSPWESPLSIWRRKVEGIDSPPTIRMKMGLALEEPIRQEYERQTGRVVRRIPRFHSFVLDNPVVPASCSIDGVVDQDGEEQLLEIKTTSRTDEWENGVPDFYAAQAQWQMLCTGISRCEVAVPLQGNALSLFDLGADPAVQARALEAAMAFWEHVVSRTTPPVDGSEATSKALRALYRSETAGKRIVLPAGEAMAWFQERVAITREIAFLTERKREIDNRFVAAVGDAEVAEIPGYGDLIYRTQHRAGYSVEPKSCRVLCFPRLKE